MKLEKFKKIEMTSEDLSLALGGVGGVSKTGTKGKDFGDERGKSCWDCVEGDTTWHCFDGTKNPECDCGIVTAPIATHSEEKSFRLNRVASY